MVIADKQMRGKTMIVVVAIMAFGTSATWAVNVDFYTDAVIQDGDFYDRVRVYDTPPLPTTVNMTGGGVGVGGLLDGNSGMFTYDSSLVNISGGSVDYLYTYNSSRVNISGGSVGGFGKSLNVHDSSTVSIFGGHVGFELSCSEFWIYDSAVVNIDTKDAGLSSLTFARDSSTVNIYRGYVHTLSAGDSSTVNIYGGGISGWGFSVGPSAKVNIYGYGFEHNPKWYWAEDSPIWGTGWVSCFTGYGFEGIPIKIIGMPDPSANSNINLIPEPSTLVLFALGSLPLLMKNRDSHARGTLCVDP